MKSQILHYINFGHTAQALKSCTVFVHIGPFAGKFKFHGENQLLMSWCSCQMCSKRIKQWPYVPIVCGISTCSHESHLGKNIKAYIHYPILNKLGHVLIKWECSDNYFSDFFYLSVYLRIWLKKRKILSKNVARFNPSTVIICLDWHIY